MDRYLDIVQRYPIGSAFSMQEESTRTFEVQGYEFYNGAGYLLLTDNTKISMEQITKEIKAE